MTLKDYFAKNPSAALAFSGGADSSYLLYEAHRLGANLQPYFVKSEFQPQFELDGALLFCERLGVKLKVLNIDILDLPKVVLNSDDRCYHCKTAMLKLLRRRAEMDGYKMVLDGTNASDDAAERPGMRALVEFGVRSPLRMCGLTKDDILRRSREAGLQEKASYSCLATRIPHGQTITKELLSRIEGAENALIGLGFTDFRVRVFHDTAKLEMKADQMSDALTHRDEINTLLAPFFDTVMLDMRAR